MQASNQWDCGRAIAKDPKHGSNTQEIKKVSKNSSVLSKLQYGKSYLALCGRHRTPRTAK